MNLSTRHLRAFVALADTRNFTRAAERCHLSQSAFSALIRSIESTLGARLFDRDTRHVELTPEGELFRGSAQRVLGDFDELIADFRDHAARKKGRVTIAALPSLAAGWLPTVLAEFRSLCPGVELALFDALSDNCLALVRAGKADFAAAASGEHAPDLSTERLCADRFHLVCRRDHPLARRSRLRLADLQPYPFVHLARSSSVRQHIDAVLRPLQLQPLLEVEHLATVMGMVAGGVGVSVVPALTLFHFRHPEIVVRAIADPGLTRELFLARRAGRSLSIAAQGLWDLMLSRKPQVPSLASRRRKVRRQVYAEAAS